MSKYEDIELATIGDSTDKGNLLEIGCHICGRHGYYSHDQVRLPTHLTFEAASWRLACSTCGARNLREPQWPVWIRPDARGARRGNERHAAIVDRPGRDWYQQQRYLKLPINAWLANVRSE